MKMVIYSRPAIKVLRRLPANTTARLRSKIDQYAADPQSLANNVKALTDRKGWRLRVGDWRIIFDEDGAVLEVMEIGARGGVYD